MIYTIGHSTHSAEDFLRLLQTHGVRQLADIRTRPQSRRHPHFGGRRLEDFLSTHGIVYQHFAALGGFRDPQPASINTAWRNDFFRGYADYMQTEAFEKGVHGLLEFAQVAPTAAMCAEAAWIECHRQLLADALLVRGVPVLHIDPRGEPKLHELGPFARVEDGKVIYPGLL